MKNFLLTFSVLSVFGVALNADDLVLGAGGGYKKPVSVVIENLKKDGISVDGAYAQIGQIVAQAKDGNMGLIVGDEAFLQKSDLKVLEYAKLGRGELVLVTAKDKKLNDISEISKLEKIAIPDGKKAIYGIRALEFVKNAGLENALNAKIMQVSNVLQVVTYVANGEVDAGFINATEAIVKKDEFGSIIYIDQDLYSPVYISVAKLEKCDKNEVCEKVLEEFKSERSKKIFEEFGVK